MKGESRVGDRLRKLRESRNLKQTELAAKLHFSNPNTISMYERNRRLPSVETVLMYSEIFNVPVDWILKGNSNDYSVFVSGYKYCEMVQSFSLICSKEIREVAVEQVNALLRLEKITN